MESGHIDDLDKRSAQIDPLHKLGIPEFELEGHFGEDHQDQTNNAEVRDVQQPDGRPQSQVDVTDFADGGRQGHQEGLALIIVRRGEIQHVEVLLRHSHRAQRHVRLIPEYHQTELMPGIAFGAVAIQIDDFDVPALSGFLEESILDAIVAERTKHTAFWKSSSPRQTLTSWYFR